MSAGTLQIDVLANTQKLVAGMNKAEATVKGSARVMKNAMLGFAGIFLSGKLASSIGRTMDEIDKIGKTSSKLGIATDALIGLQHGAEQSGLSVETLNMALQRSTRRISEAAQGTGEAVKALEELGLSAEALNQMSPDEQLNEIADAMVNVSGQSERVRLSMKLFDSEGVAMVNMLKDGSAGLKAFHKDAVDLGIALDSSMVKKVEDANDAMDRLNKASSVMGTTMSVQLAPYIKIASEWMIEFTKSMKIAGSGSTIFASIIQGVARTFIIGFNAMRTSIDGWAIIWAHIQTLIAKFGGDTREIEDAMHAQSIAIQVARESSDELLKSLLGLDQGTLNLLKSLNALDTKYKKISVTVGKTVGKAMDTTVEAMDRTQKAVDSVASTMESSIGNAFRGMMDGAVDFADMMGKMAKTLLLHLCRS